jgi:glycerol-3-phosphate cytidylyltransferase/D-beta-D-heptose 7-phosphate kinase/D-beta-D-heptose 1-phosphate adenosyltransferase
LSTIAIVSGYFNPLHVGHLRMMLAASDGADSLVVIVNNDRQQVMKKGKVITAEAERLEIVNALSVVDEAFVAVDDDGTVKDSLRRVRQAHPDARLVFCNGGDRSRPEAVAEYELCRELGIELAFGVGGEEKADSSSRINAELGV